MTINKLSDLQHTFDYVSMQLLSANDVMPASFVATLEVVARKKNEKVLSLLLYNLQHFLTPTSGELLRIQYGWFTIR